MFRLCAVKACRTPPGLTELSRGWPHSADFGHWGDLGNPPKEAATGAAVVIAPGGGHSELWMDHEGYRVAKWLSDHGVAAFVLKYRLAREPGSTYTVEGSALPDGDSGCHGSSRA